MEINRYEIDAGLQKSLRAAVVSDLHSSPFEGLLGVLEKEAPDLILCPGDMIHRANPHEKGIDFLARAAEKYPVFCSLGNHEVKRGIDVRDALRATGATLLDNEWVGFGEIVIGGLSTGYSIDTEQGRCKKTPPPNIEALDGFFKQKRFKILLSHHPEYYPRHLKDKDVGLIISGHAHGGQWRIFGQGIFAPGQGLFPKYTSGFYDKKMLVSRGLANNIKIPRIFNKPELIILDLK